jgi:hypothetical protein
MRSLLLLLVLLAGCAIVKPYEREHLTDPTMTEDAVEAASMRKLHTSREGAGGGDGAPAGGGCGCSN